MTQPATTLAPDPTGVPLLEVRGVAKSFPGVKALQDMHLTLRRGEVLALVGENADTLDAKALEPTTQPAAAPAVKTAQAAPATAAEPVEVAGRPSR